MGVEDLRQLGREALIRMAAEKISRHNRNDTFDADNFDQVSVMAGEDSVLVRFAMSVRYMPIRSRYSHWATVDLAANTIVANSERGVLQVPLSPDHELGFTFFRPSASSTAVVLSILKRIHPEVKSVRDFRLPRGSYLQIREKLLTYEVIQRSPYSYSFYKLTKWMGLVLRSEHENLLVPDDDNGMVEIE